VEKTRTIGLTGSWDTRISRRTLLRTGGTAALSLVWLSRAAAARAHPPRIPEVFSLGVASGDPTPDGFVLWTRLCPEPLESGGGLDEDPYGVRYEIAADPEFARIVQRGTADAVPEEALSVHAEIAGLEPATWYWYRFAWSREISRVGRTRTAPPLGAGPERIRFAFVSCQNYSQGYYPAYADLARQEDIELVVHLGDYIYEGNGVSELAIRPHVPRATLTTLDAYRTRHAQYKTDPDLQDAHAAFPWLLTWDDHEVSNNYAGLHIGVQPPEVVAARRAAAYQAYWEHQPLARSRKPLGPDMSMYRREPWGDLATFHVLDTRQYRDVQLGNCAPAERDPVSAYCPEELNPARTIMGSAQRQWLLEGLAEGPRGGWNILANQVGFAPQVDLDPNKLRWFMRTDTWDGYVADRQRILDFAAEQDIRNLVVITGDKHENTVRNVARSYTDIAGPPVATEFVGTSISSEGDGGRPTAYGLVNNPHVLFENFRRGYVHVDADHATWRADFRVVDSVQTRDVPAYTVASFGVENGKPGGVLLGRY
jgi:alkaline phosphatase D